MVIRPPTPRSVFINCPFDEKAGYKKLFDALIFTVFDCGFFVRCGLETQDSGEQRFRKICELIDLCPYAIHDISKTELDTKTGLPRFNMPLELGIYLGAKEFGPRKNRNKRCLVMDSEQHRYLAFCSDLRGVDIGSHNNRTRDLIREVHDWLQSQELDLTGDLLYDADYIYGRFRKFIGDLPSMCAAKKIYKLNRIKYGVYTTLMTGWLQAHPKGEEESIA